MAKRKAKVLPGMEDAFVQEIEDAGENYYDVMSRRVKLSKEEDEMKTALIEAMQAARLNRYIMADGKIVTLTEKSNVRVRSPSGKDDNETAE